MLSANHLDMSKKDQKKYIFALSGEGLDILEKRIDTLGLRKGKSGRPSEDLVFKAVDALTCSKSTIKRVRDGLVVSEDLLKHVCEKLEFETWKDFLKEEESDQSSSDDAHESDHSTLYPYYIPSGTSHFKGRDAELDTLHQALYAKEKVAIYAVEGMGGVGKTELAIQYAKRYQQCYLGGICFIFARELQVGDRIVGFARSTLMLEVPVDLELPEQLAYCWRKWIPGEVLIILDDVTDFEVIQPYLPPKHFTRFKILITTRLTTSTDEIHSIPLEVLSLEDSLELLKSIIGPESINSELDSAIALCEWLGHLPLGLELVGWYVVDRRKVGSLLLSDMLQRLIAASQKDTAIKHKSLAKPKNRFFTAKKGVEAAFDLSWEELNLPSKHLGKKLGQCADEPIPLYFIEKFDQKYREKYPEDSELVGETLEDALWELLNIHLLKQIDDETYRLHSLIREFFRSKLEKGE